jgi:hypothetical protein
MSPTFKWSTGRRKDAHMHLHRWRPGRARLTDGRRARRLLPDQDDASFGAWTAGGGTPGCDHAIGAHRVIVSLPSPGRTIYRRTELKRVRYRRTACARAVRPAASRGFRLRRHGKSQKHIFTSPLLGCVWQGSGSGSGCGSSSCGCVVGADSVGELNPFWENV